MRFFSIKYKYLVNMETMLVRILILKERIFLCGIIKAFLLVFLGI